MAWPPYDSETMVILIGVTLFLFGFVAGFLFRGVARLVRPGPLADEVDTTPTHVLPVVFPPAPPPPAHTPRHAMDGPTSDLRSRVRPAAPGQG